MEDYGFKFKIGDVVQHVVQAPLAAPDWNDDRSAWAGGVRISRMLVTSLALEICSGGVQRHCYCRSADRHGGASTGVTRFNEIELEASEAFKAVEKKAE